MNVYFKQKILPRINKRLINAFQYRLQEVDYYYIINQRISIVSPSNFRFIQIGAYDGISDDQITNFIQNYNIPGILLEPQIDVYNKLVENYSKQKNLILLNCALSTICGESDFFTIKDSVGVPSWAKQAASFHKDNLLKLKYGIPEHGIPSIPNIENLIQNIPVKTINFDGIFALLPSAFESIELLQIDAEGYDAEIIEMFPFHKIIPTIIRFEHMHLKNNDYVHALKKLKSLGYSILTEKSDTVAFISYRIGC
jgi:FkbM family methyltransferase